MNDSISGGVIYHGINGYGITWTYFLMNLLMVLVAVFGIILNCLIFYITRQKGSCNDVSEIFIHNLAASDAINGVVCVYVLFYNLIHYKHYYECALRYGLVCCVNLNSAIHLLFLTFDRFFKIQYPFKYVEIFKEKPAQVCSVCSWVFSAILSVLPIAGWRQDSLGGIFYCSFFGVLTKGYLSLIILLCCALFVTIMICYGSILWVSWVQRKKSVRGSLRTSSKPLWWQPTKTVLMLITLYCVCWIPTGIYISIHICGGLTYLTNEQKGTIFSYIGVCVFANTVGNPIIYAMMCTTVQDRLKRTLRYLHLSNGLTTRPAEQNNLRKNRVAIIDNLTTTAFMTNNNPEGEGHVHLEQLAKEYHL